MILAITDGSETFIAVKAFVWLLAGVSSHVDEEVAFLCKDFAAIGLIAFEQVLP